MIKRIIDDVNVCSQQNHVSTATKVRLVKNSSRARVPGPGILGPVGPNAKR